MSWLLSLLKAVAAYLLISCESVRVQSRPDIGSTAGLRPSASTTSLGFDRSQRTETTIPSPLTQSPRSLPAIKVDPTGKVYRTQILKQQLADELGLPLRDLRIVDPSFPSQIQATFMARPNVILFCIENIKVVVQRNEALVFSPYEASVQEFVPVLQQQIALAANGADGDDNVNILVNSARFEHIVIESALNLVCSSLLRRVRSLRPAVTSALNDLTAESRGLDVVQTQVDELLPLKNKLDVLRKRVKEVKRAITETLNSDEDMAMMQLGSPFLYDRKKKVSGGETSGDNDEGLLDLSDGVSFDEVPSPPPPPPAGGAEVLGGDVVSMSGAGEDKRQEEQYFATMNLEMLFETYLNEVEWIGAEVEDEIDEITNTEENVVLQLDLLRNRLLRFELMLSISSFVIACGALITGLFGMNLLSHIEFHKRAFYIVTGLMVSGMVAAFFSFKRYARRQKLF